MAPQYVKVHPYVPNNPAVKGVLKPSGRKVAAAAVGGLGVGYVAGRRNGQSRVVAPPKGLKPLEPIKPPKPYGVAKGLGEWKTIDQREREAAAGRRRKRSGVGYAASSAGLLYGMHRYDPRALRGATKLPSQMRLLDQVGRVAGQSMGQRAINQMHMFAQRPTQAAALGIGAFGAVNVARALRGHAQDKYHQGKINERRRQNYRAAQARGRVAKASKWGDSTFRGRKILDEPVEKAMRHHDPEAKRQRRLGAYQATAFNGAALLGLAGAAGVRGRKLASGRQVVIVPARNLAALGGATGLALAGRKINRHANSDRNERYY